MTQHCCFNVSLLLLFVVVVVSQSNPVDMNEIMSFELSAFPLTLFEKYTYLCKPNKLKLVDAIVNIPMLTLRGQLRCKY